MDNMGTEANSQEGKTGYLETGELGRWDRWLTDRENIMALD